MKKKYGWYVVTAPIPVRSFLIGLPVGSIIWWCARRAVLRKKANAAELTLGAHPYTDTSRDPWE